LPVSSFDTCDRWKAGLSESIKDEEIDFFFFWSADFKFNDNSVNSAKLLLDYDGNYDLVIGTIDASGKKELIDSLATIPLIEHWFPKEGLFISEKGFSKPRSELFKISKKFASFLISNRWYPSEQTINILLQCIWNSDRFKMNQISLGKIQDDDQSRSDKNIIQQIERMELWLKYMWRDYNKRWSSEEYLSLSSKSSFYVNKINEKLLKIDKSNILIDDEENYRLIIDNSWKDIHHSRNQDWTALGVVFGAHIGIFQLLDYLKDKISTSSVDIYYVLGGIVGIVLSVIGAAIAYRHRDLSKIKMQWICEAEEFLGLLKTRKNPLGVVDPKKYKGISTSWLIIAIYLIFALIDLSIITIFYG
jgi:hypothetical protein